MTARLLASLALACSLAPGLAAAQAGAVSAPASASAAAASAASAPAVAASASARAASAPAASAPARAVAASAPADAASAPAVAASASAGATSALTDPVPAVPVAAAVPTSPPAATVPVAPSPMAGPSAGNLLQTIFALTLVLALLFGMAWFMKRYGPKAAAGGANLRTIGALSLGGRERIVVVEVGDQWIVVGASPGRINALATMPKQETAPGTATLSPYAPPASSFAEWLKQTIDKRNAK